MRCLAGKLCSRLRSGKSLTKKYKYFYGKDDWKGSIYELYNEFLKSQAENGYDIDIPEDEFDVYDLAALAYIYKRIKETDPVKGGEPCRDR